MDEYESLSLFPEKDEREGAAAPTGRRRIAAVAGLALLAAMAVKAGIGGDAAGPGAATPPVATATAQPTAAVHRESLGDRPHTPYIWAGANRREVERWIDEHAASLRRAYARQAARNRAELERCGPVTPS